MNIYIRTICRTKSLEITDNFVLQATCIIYKPRGMRSEDVLQLEFNKNIFQIIYDIKDTKQSEIIDQLNSFFELKLNEQSCNKINNFIIENHALIEAAKEIEYFDQTNIAKLARFILKKHSKTSGNYVSRKLFIKEARRSGVQMDMSPAEITECIANYA